MAGPTGNIRDFALLNPVPGGTFGT